MEMEMHPHNNNNNNNERRRIVHLVIIISYFSYRLPLDHTIQVRYRLVFINKVKSPSFTTDNLVRDENGDPIKVAIYDMCSQSFISPDCFLSSAKVRITVLEAEYWENKGENWSRSEFNQSVLREREGRGPILIGRPSLTIRLQNGLGTFENIVFKDNSSWTKGGFRLGVMVEGEGEEGYLNGERVQEGVSEPFRVKDRRGEASQNPDLLELRHQVQSLKKVGKDHASLLQSNSIKTVEDFLSWYYNKQPELRKILGIKSESDKGWKSMVEHAMQCANEFHSKYNALNSSSQPQKHVNVGPRVVGSDSSKPNPHQNDIIEGDMAAIYGSQISRSDNFDPGLCEALVRGFIESMSNNVHYVVPQTLHRKRKMKALFRSVAFVAVLRKRARIVTPV
ncbi:calmodulin-binding protein 60 B-like [Carex rostrata]